MPPVRSIGVVDEEIRLDDFRGVPYRLRRNQIPGNLTLVQAEAFARQWLQDQVAGAYVIDIHIFSLSPFHATLYAGDAGTSIPANWWGEQA
jgi:hypothetical protein